MKTFVRSTLLLTAFCAFAARADAGLVLNGPSSFAGIGQHISNWGIQFTAQRNTTLTGFDFNHQANVLIDALITVLDVTNPSSPVTLYTKSFPGPQPSPVVVSGLSIALQKDHNYQILDTPSSILYPQFAGADLVYTYLTSGFSPYSNADIRVTNGVHNGVNDDWDARNVWYAFTKIRTDVDAQVGVTGLAAPEPSTMVVWTLLGMVGACIYRKPR